MQTGSCLSDTMKRNDDVNQTVCIGVSTCVEANSTWLICRDGIKQYMASEFLGSFYLNDAHKIWTLGPPYIAQRHAYLHAANGHCTIRIFCSLFRRSWCIAVNTCEGLFEWYRCPSKSRRPCLPRIRPAYRESGLKRAISVEKTGSVARESSGLSRVRLIVVRLIEGHL